MNIYFTDAIGINSPGNAIIKAAHDNDAILKIIEFCANTEYSLFKTKMVVGEELDEIDYSINVTYIRPALPSDNIDIKILK